jgi:hypothetical protein
LNAPPPPYKGLQTLYHTVGLSSHSTFFREKEAEGGVGVVCRLKQSWCRVLVVKTSTPLREKLNFFVFIMKFVSATSLSMFERRMVIFDKTFEKLRPTVLDWQISLKHILGEAFHL